MKCGSQPAKSEARVVQDAGGATLDQEVLKNFLIDVGQYYQPGGSYMV